MTNLGSEGQVKKSFEELLEKYGIDEDKWKNHLNDLPSNEREFNFIFDTRDVKDGFSVKFTYIFTGVEINIKDKKVLKEIEEGNMD